MDPAGLYSRHQALPFPLPMSSRGPPRSLPPPNPPTTYCASASRCFRPCRGPAPRGDQWGSPIPSASEGGSARRDAPFINPARAETVLHLFRPPGSRTPLLTGPQCCSPPRCCGHDATKGVAYKWQWSPVGCCGGHEVVMGWVWWP